MLLGEDIEGVVDGDDAEHVPRLVAHRDGNEVVLGHLVRHVLLVEIGGHPDDVAVGDVGQRPVAVGDDERAQAEHADERPGGVERVDVVDALEILVELADGVDGVLDG